MRTRKYTEMRVLGIIISSVYRYISPLYRNLLPRFFRLHIRRILISFNNEVRRELDFFLIYRNKIEAQIGSSFISGLLESIQLTEEVEGDIIELGTYKGGSTIIMAHFLERIGSKRHICACDTFKGHPYDDDFSCQKDRKGQYSDTSVSYVMDKFRKFGVEDKIIIIRGLFEDTLLSELGEKRFSLALVDCDLYSSTKYALDFLYQRMEDGARIVVHDYGKDWWGLTKAVNEWCQKKDFKINLYPIPHITINARFL